MNTGHLNTRLKQVMALTLKIDIFVWCSDHLNTGSRIMTWKNSAIQILSVLITLKVVQLSALSLFGHYLNTRHKTSSIQLVPVLKWSVFRWLLYFGPSKRLATWHVINWLLYIHIWTKRMWGLIKSINTPSYCSQTKSKHFTKMMNLASSN